MRLIGCITLAIICTAALAQEPPRPLPASVINSASPGAITPVAGVNPQQTPSAVPIARFQDLLTFPPETIQAVYSMRSGSEWLWRMNQANGRFVPGINPSLKSMLDTETDFRQALGAWALADSARFTGDDRYTSRAVQSILGLLAMTKLNADATQRIPTTKSAAAGTAAALVLAIHRLPGADAKLIAQADQLCGFLRSQCPADGSIVSDACSTDPEAAALTPGLVIQALMMIKKPENREIVAKAVAKYRGAKLTPTAAAALLPGFVEFALQNNKDAATVTTVFEMADFLCSCQFRPAEVRTPVWSGGFKQNPIDFTTEPGWEAATISAGLVAAAKLTRNVPDLIRYQKYRTAAVNGLLFTRNLQFNENNSEQFEKNFRLRFLVGGMCAKPSEGSVRLESTALLVSAHLQFLESGAEGRTE